MIVRIAAMEEELKLSQEEIGVLEIAERRLFSKIVQQLHQMQTNQPLEKQQIILVENHEIVTLENQLLLFDLCTVPDSLKRQLMKKLISAIEFEVAKDVEMREAWLELQRSMFMQTVDFLSSYQIEYDFTEVVQISSFLKAVQLEIEFEQTYNPIDLLQLLLKLNNQFNLYDRIVIVDCKKYLTKSEIIHFYEQATLTQQMILLVEANHDQRVFAFERKLQIHDDFTCQIVANMV
ncbi:MAG: type II-A CRISPR-associated protein Csn2 [Culicoidibacterales bacterium]